MVKALNVCNNILVRAFRENIDITPMKLQKLVYIVYKTYIKKTGKPLFPERFEAWKYGPVISDVYDEFKEFRSNAIKRYAYDNGSIYIVDETAENFKESLEEVWGKYKNIGGIPLSTMTHQKKTAWYEAIKNDKVFLNDDDIIKEEDYVK